MKPIKDLTSGHTMEFERGFSLIELMVVVVVMGLLFFSVPALKKHSANSSLIQASENLASTLRLARQRAVAAGINAVVVFDVATNSYYIFDDVDGDGNLSSDEKQTALTKLPSGVNFADVNFGQNKVSFNPRGSADQTGDVVLINRNRIARQILLNAPTGLVYISDTYSLGGGG